MFRQVLLTTTLLTLLTIGNTTSTTGASAHASATALNTATFGVQGYGDFSLSSTAISMPSAIPSPYQPYQPASSDNVDLTVTLSATYTETKPTYLNTQSPQTPTATPVSPFWNTTTPTGTIAATSPNLAATPSIPPWAVPPRPCPAGYTHTGSSGAGSGTPTPRAGGASAGSAGATGGGIGPYKPFVTSSANGTGAIGTPSAQSAPVAGAPKMNVGGSMGALVVVMVLLGGGVLM